MKIILTTERIYLLKIYPSFMKGAMDIASDTDHLVKPHTKGGLFGYVRIGLKPKISVATTL